ncbi:fumarylacetoacetate hydrolase family protein [Sulfitobacter aestuarii]|uniref:Fumarylacetoacetate hydrolase family protein n=1 Tax=Sulfitobacter aestuarii TaxID=2161676 RepID=A0ABW5U9M7_9RHOB
MYIFDPPEQASLAVQGRAERFPVRRVFCVGRNYAAHAREMGNDPDCEPPFFFTKPADAVIDTPCTIAYPPLTEDLHHEIELVLAIGRGGAEISEAQAQEHIWGAAVGLDMTRRDLQRAAKGAGRPWDWAKAFDQSAPVGEIRPLVDVSSLSGGKIWLSVNGKLRQQADLADQIWPVAAQVAILSQAVTLAPGDLIMTGTPAGVGPVVPGDVITGGIDGIGELEVTIGDRT